HSVTTSEILPSPHPYKRPYLCQYPALLTAISVPVPSPTNSHICPTLHQQQSCQGDTTTTLHPDLAPFWAPGSKGTIQYSSLAALRLLSLLSRLKKNQTNLKVDTCEGLSAIPCRVSLPNECCREGEGDEEVEEERELG